MEAHGDRNWLRGDPSWWRLPSTSPVPRMRPSEVIFPEEFTTPEAESRFGWERQRMRPLAWTVLKPLAWSPFFLIASVIPLLFTGSTPDDQAVSGSLFIISWLLLILPVANARNNQPTSDDSLLALPVDWFSISLGLIFFIFHIEYSPILGWLSYAIFWVAFFRSIKMISDVFSVPPARIILPIDRESWNSTDLSSDWVVTEKIWKNGQIAVAHLGSGKLKLHGMSRGNTNFMSLSYICRFGFVQDCLFVNNPESEGIFKLLREFPVTSSEVEWPANLIIFDEEE